jgi:hypothetical protein
LVALGDDHAGCDVRGLEALDDQVDAEGQLPDEDRSDDEPPRGTMVGEAEDGGDRDREQ